ncbi:MAG TPA: tagatose 1,6-diphosphate aldolase [Vicinamibacterales bacterium]|nr:tagatose 1,6-diphosphate aldolase [Vicinamibacterales bacterium]
MSNLGLFRRLAQCSGDEGTFCILAIDHRDNLIAELQKHHTPVAYEDVVGFKTSVARLAEGATAVLIDPDYGARALINRVIPGAVGTLAPLEVTDYRPHPSQRKPRFIPGWSVAKLKRAGFAGAKLLLYYHPDADDARDKTSIVDRVVADCASEEVPLFLEPITYSPDPSRDLDNWQRREAVIAAARHFSRRGVAIMKMEFPLDVKAERNEQVWADALAELNDACAVPWALLSAGVPYEVFVRQARLACQAGASGIIAGRAVWADAVALSGPDRERFLETEGRRRVDELREICRTATPWTRKVEMPMLEERWYA